MSVNNNTNIELCNYDPTMNNSTGGSSNSIQSQMHDNDYYKYKAMKYHYKIQNVLKKMMADGKSIPDEYMQYLNDFDN